MKILKFTGKALLGILTLIMAVLFVSVLAIATNNEDVFVTKKETPRSSIILTTDNVVNLRLPFSKDSIGSVIKKLSELDSSLPSDYPIYLTLSTPGGSIMAGLDLYTFVAGMNRPVHTVTFFAASMGFQTVQQLGDRHIVDAGVLMSHQAYGGFEGEFTNGKSQLDSRYALWLQIIKELDTHTVMRTNGKETLESYQAAYENEMWLTGKRSVDRGFADYLAAVSCHKNIMNAEETLVFGSLFGRITVVLPKCPLDKRVIRMETEINTNKGAMSLDKLTKLNPALKTCSQIQIEAKYSKNLKLLETPCPLNPEATQSSITKEIESIRSLVMGNVGEYMLSQKNKK